MNSAFSFLAAMLVAWGCSKSSQGEQPSRPIVQDQGRKPMKEQTGFTIDDLYVYQGKGLVKVEKLEEHGGKEIVMLRVLDGEMMIGLPIVSAHELLRKPMNMRAAQQTWTELKKPAVPDGRIREDRHFDNMRTMVKGTLDAQVERLRIMYSSPYKPSFGERRMIQSYESMMFSELAHVLGKSTEELRQEMQTIQPVFAAEAKDRPPEPERPEPAPDGPKIGGYELLGSFEVKGGLVVADPARVSSSRDAEAGLNFRVAATPGKWYGYIAEDEEMGRVGILVAIHSSKLGAMPKRSLSKLQKKSGVTAEVRIDGGQLAILDQAVREDERYEDEMFFRTRTGTVLGRGCTSESGFGDGTYPISVAMEVGHSICACRSRFSTA